MSEEKPESNPLAPLAAIFGVLIVIGLILDHFRAFAIALLAVAIGIALFYLWKLNKLFANPFARSQKLTAQLQTPAAPVPAQVIPFPGTNLQATPSVFHPEQVIPPEPFAGMIEHGRFADEAADLMFRKNNASEIAAIETKTWQEVGRIFKGFIPEGTEPGGSIELIDMMTNVPDAISALVQPFFTDDIKRLKIFRETRDQIHQNWDEAAEGKLTKAQLERGKRLTPKDFKGSPREMVEQYLANTSLEKLFYDKVAYNFPDKYRFRHQFAVGASGTGKTTFLSSQIVKDLERVERGEASLFVMDSQNELIRHMAHFKQFAPGGSLYGKLIYIEPDPDYPPSLNILNFDKQREQQASGKNRAALAQSTYETIKFFIEAVVRTDTSGFMDGILRYVLRAVALIPNATMFEFADMLDPDGYLKRQKHFGALSDQDRQFLTQRMKDFGPSLLAVRNRLGGFLSDPEFNAMFSQPRSKFDLFDELKEPKVILINTLEGVLGSAKEPFGRFFIAKLLQASEQRSLILDGEEKLPVFAYIDEAQDYLKQEHRFQELQQKARKQNISLTIATHDFGDFDAPVQRALKAVAIQTWGVEEGVWNVSLDSKPPFVLRPPDINFKRMDKMTDGQFDAILRDMRKRYCTPRGEIDNPPPTSPTPTPPATPTTPASLNAQQRRAQRKKGNPQPEKGGWERGVK
jgi:hypothetical protein